MRHDCRDHPARPRDRQHVLDEHEVSLLALLRRVAVAEALGERDGVSHVVHRERRVGDHPVEPLQLPAGDVGWVFKRAVVVVPEVRIGDAMQQHVHFGDGPDAAVLLLAGKCQVAAVATGLLDVLLGQDQHAARAGAWVVDAHPRRAGRRSAPSGGPRRGACRTRRPSSLPSRRSRRSSTRRPRPAGQGTRSPRCRSGTLLKCMISSRSFLSDIEDWPILRLKSMCWSTPSSDRLLCSSSSSALFRPLPTALWSDHESAPIGRAAARRRSCRTTATPPAAQPRPGCAHVAAGQR